MVNRAHSQIKKKIHPQSRKRPSNGMIGVKTKRRNMAATKSSGIKGINPASLRRCETVWNVETGATDETATLSDTSAAIERRSRGEIDSVVPDSTTRMESRIEDRTEGQRAHDADPVKSASFDSIDINLPARNSRTNLYNEAEFDPAADSEDDSLDASGSAQPSRSKLPTVYRRTKEHGDASGTEERDVFAFPVSPSKLPHEELRNLNPYIEAPTSLDESLVSSSSLCAHPSPDAHETTTLFTVHGLPATPPLSTRGEAVPSITVSNLHPIEGSGEDQHKRTTIDSEEPSTASAKELANRIKSEPSAQLISLRDQLPFKLLSCIKPDSLRSANYDHLLELLELLSRVPMTKLEDSTEDHLQLENIALYAWTHMLYMFSNFRRDTGFYGDRDEWTAYAATLEMSKRFAATLSFAEMRSFLAKLKRKCEKLTATNLGQTVAPSLWTMAGKPDYLPLEDLADYLCTFCAELFIWFE